MAEDRCPECGSWDRCCANPEPVADCGCQRCLRAALAALRQQHADAKAAVLDLHAWLAKEWLT